MTRLLIRYFKEKGITEYRVVKHSIQNNKIIYLNGVISKKEESWDLNILIFNINDKHGYIYFDIIDNNLIRTLDFILTNEILSDKNLNLTLNENDIKAKHFIPIDFNKYFIENIKCLRIKYAELNTFIQTTEVFQYKFRHKEKNIVSFVEYQGKDFRLTSNISNKLSMLNEIENQQICHTRSNINKKLNNCKNQKILFTEQPTITLLGYLITAFNGNNMDAGKTFINKEMLGQKLFPSYISIKCHSNFYFNFDGEGSLLTPHYLIENGVLKSFLYDLRINEFPNSTNDAHINYFTKSINISSPLTELIIDKSSENSFDILIRHIKIQNSNIDYLTGNMKVEMVGFDKKDKKTINYTYFGNILDLFMNITSVYGERKNVEEYMFKNFIVKIK